MARFSCILLVDDDGTTNFVNQRLLNKLNLSERIHTAINGDRAIQFITQFAFQHNNNCPELIFLDLNMPGADGFDFLYAFNEMEFANKAKVRLIVLTTSNHKKDLDLLEANNIAFINKPLTEDKLEKILASIISE